MFKVDAPGFAMKGSARLITFKLRLGRRTASGCDCGDTSQPPSGRPRSGALRGPVVLTRGEVGDVVELLEKLCSHRMLEDVGWRSDIDPPPGKPLQHLHRQGITEPPIQFIPIIQQRPLVAIYRGLVTEKLIFLDFLRVSSWSFVPLRGLLFSCPSWITPHSESRCFLPPERSAV